MGRFFGATNRFGAPLVGIGQRREKRTQSEHEIHNDTVVAEANGVAPYLPLSEMRKRARAPEATSTTVQGGQ